VGDVNESGHSRPFNPATDLQRLIDATRSMRDLKLVVLDPVVAVITGDSHKNSETRRDLQPLVSLAEQLDVAVLGITHLSKGSSGREPMERVMGSIAFAAVARVVLATVKARDRRTPHRLVRAKSNLGLDHGGLEYTLAGVPVPGHDFPAQRVEWGQRLDGSAHELMAIEAPDEEEEARAEVMAFLQDQLAAGPVATREIRAAAAANGYKWRTMERAKTDLGVTAKKGVGGLWYWARPGEATPAPSQQHRHTADGGGVVDGEAERQVRELEDSIARQRETVRILASAGQSTVEAERLLESMGEELEALQWKLRRDDRPGTPAAVGRRRK
jgi:putative DNA primase/helicase